MARDEHAGNYAISHGSPTHIAVEPAPVHMPEPGPGTRAAGGQAWTETPDPSHVPHEGDGKDAKPKKEKEDAPTHMRQMLILAAVVVIIANIAASFVLILVQADIDQNLLQIYAFISLIFLPFTCVWLCLGHYFYAEAHMDPIYVDKKFKMAFVMLLCFAWPCAAIMFLCQTQNLRAQYMGCLSCFMTFFCVVILLLAAAYLGEM